MPTAPAKSRLRRLLIALAITALVAAAYHIAEYRLAGQSSVIGRIGSSARRYFVDQTPNYSKIEDGLWMGGYVEQPPAGTQAVLNLCEAKDPYEVESHRVAAIPDGPPAPSLEWLGRQVAFIESERAAGRTVYVHCYGGVSRSGMVMAAYLMRREGWSADRAIHFLQSKRQVVSPNPVFRPLLAEWERMVKGMGAGGGGTQR
jgi:protein-tyrosine phosphatase